MSNVVRIVERTQKPDEELNITLEVRVNKKRIENKMVFFGFLGSLKDDENLLPFVLHRDGQLDFGSLFDDEDRFGRTNIHERPIELGTFFSTRMNIGDPSTPSSRSGCAPG